MSADAFDRRIVTLLAFGPALTVTLLSLVTGRGTVAMWGYPLWLFLGLWIVLHARPLERVTLDAHRVPVGRGLCRFRRGVSRAAYAVRPRFSSSATSRCCFPGDQLGQEMSRRFRALTGQPLAYVIGRMWDGGNVGHYAPERPRVLIDGRPAAGAVDRPRRSAGRAARSWCGPMAAIRACCRRPTAPSPTTRKSSRRSRCRSGWGPTR